MNEEGHVLGGSILGENRALWRCGCGGDACSAAGHLLGETGGDTRAYTAHTHAYFPIKSFTCNSSHSKVHKVKLKLHLQLGHEKGVS